jgi:D-alanyl-D-alanine carboxypeptidase (penicillin-binding protein 5/6)
MDIDNKEILLSRNSDERIAPSSMTKLMTAYVVFDQIKKGIVQLDNRCMIGKDAWRKSGSSMFLNYGDVVSIDSLVKGLLAVSGNDASIALAESTAGGLNNFVALMNSKAKELGLKNSHFRNPHGLSEPDHYMSIRDLATLAIRLHQDFPQYSHYFGIPEFTYRNITQRNRNPLIRENYDGIVGGKTGHTNEGGYGVIGIVKRNHRHLIAVMNKGKHQGKELRLLQTFLITVFIIIKN